jgi:hypothetical protein
MTGCSCCEHSEKEIRVSFCPECKSRDIKYVFGLGNLFGIMPKMKCGDCGFSSVSFPVLVTNEKLLKASVDGMKEREARKRAKKKATARKKVKKKKAVKRK